ncbi:MAG TPA: PDZ domain-containing protein [Opitutaceae bacterium]|nr:PDZ domain-containing protein [Opitutaceae bacterium]
MIVRFRLRFFFLLCLPFIALGAEPIRYTLRFPEPQAHYVEVQADFPSAGHSELTVFMPVWTPGSYLVREYAKNVVELKASTLSGETLAVEKISKNRWQIKTSGQSTVRVWYRLYCREINVRGNWVEQSFAMLNGAPTFLVIVGDGPRSYDVTLNLPSGWKSSHTPLTPSKTPHVYTASDFDTLVDSPIFLGSPQVDRFDVDGVPHYLVTLLGEGAWDNARVARSLQRVVEEQRTFWGGLPYQTPYYFFNLLTGSRGGLEHRNSVTISADRWLSSTRGGVVSWLSLASHEYFHAWNGKRLRPIAHGPFDYEQENYSRALWIVEGITSYYQHVLLARAGFYTLDQYLGIVSGSIAGVERTPGQKVQSLGDASFDAWIKAYRPDENSMNALFGYYTGGAIAGLLFDAEIQRVSQGRRTLDDVMHEAYRRHSSERGYRDEDFAALASEVAGADLSGWLKRVVETPRRFDYQPFLDWYGLEFEKPTEPKPPADKNPDPVDPPRGWLGVDAANREGRLVVTGVRSDTPAAQAGLSVDDEILAIEGYRVRADELARRLGAYAVGTKLSLLIARQDKVETIVATLGSEPKETWRLKVRANSTEEQKQRRSRWLELSSVKPSR